MEDRAESASVWPPGTGGSSRSRPRRRRPRSPVRRRCRDKTGTGAPTCKGRRRAPRRPPGCRCRGERPSRRSACAAPPPQRRLGGDGGVVQQAKPHRRAWLARDGRVAAPARRRSAPARSRPPRRRPPPRLPPAWRLPSCRAKRRCPRPAPRIHPPATPAARDTRARWTASISASVAARGVSITSPSSGARPSSPMMASRRAGDSTCPGPGSWSRNSGSVKRIVVIAPPVGGLPPGKSKLNTLPPPVSIPNTDFASVIAHDSSRTNARPRPVPFSRVVKNGVKIRSRSSGGTPTPSSRTVNLDRRPPHAP